MLPSYRWLMRDGKSELVSFMRYNPEMFSHIPQNKFRKTLEEWVICAEKLAKKYGKIPSPSWLLKNKCGALVRCMYTYPESFSHIEQDKKYKNIEEGIKLAEELEKEYGTLPHKKWLLKNKKISLLGYLSKYPERFSHIKQDKKRNSVEENVKLAEKLEKEYGELPNQLWLRKNRFSGVAQSIKKSPELFKGMKQKFGNGVRTIGE